MSKPYSIIQSQYMNFELQSLGWKAFQDLCSTIISDVLGQTVQIFLPSKDGGRDGAFHGTWNGASTGGVNGSFTVQCKFTSKRDNNLSFADLSDEIKKAVRLAKRGLADNYIIMTNYQVSGTSEENIREAFLKINGIKNCLVFGSDWITLKIRESKRLRMLVPRIYGLGDLSQILDDRAYTQANEILNSMGEDLSKFVVTAPFRKSARALIEFGFVLLLGEPASGKSTISASLSLGAIDLWGCSTLKIRDANEFIKHWNPHEPRQFFWVDDAFGETQYQRETSNSWNKIFPAMDAAIKKGARILFTSRDYIYRAARSDLKTLAFPLLNESQVIINVQELEKSEKEQILYNHIKLGNQDVEFKKRIKPFLPEIVESKHFLPEIARRLGNNFFTKNIHFSKESVMKFVEKPIDFLFDVVCTLDRDSRAALALIFMGGGSIESPIQLTPEALDTVKLIGGTQSGVREALNNMDGSLVKLYHIGGSSRWIFKHPTIGDAFGSIIAEDPELLDIFLTGTRINKLVNEVTCGNVGIEGAKVIIPESRYDVILQRINEMKNRPFLYFFLAYRCDRSFLNKYIELNQDIFKEITSNLSNFYYPQVSLLARLHEFKILPEEYRLSFVNFVEKLAIEGPDSDFLMHKNRSLLKENEIIRILKSVRDELLPNISSCINEWEDSYYLDNDPAEYFSPLKEALEVFRIEFSLISDSEAEDMIERGLDEIQERINKLIERAELTVPDYDDYRPSSISQSISEKRSIFDDIDQ
jgi:hypothetical protein